MRCSLRWLLASASLLLGLSGVALARTPLVQDRAILLIDDVLTSGATANACAVALKMAGAQKVFVLTAARTPLV